ncbi:CAP domain-containing protein [Ferruginibacter lapsinanis]|uniref:CAP domain-containing protein n=1 Tax=Ferruginibacter lapsinanis TaxID=563172 RepID=UPI001E2E4F30|nr:CAP domain-containing protein [Ferruginibacter lapsinanis]UEG49645.1 CAP domain-containing protein [Ferruginibacter lapsinanis]
MKQFHIYTTIICITLFFSLNSFKSPENSSITENILRLTNQFRRSYGLNELTIRNELNALAQKHSEDMARGMVAFGHTGFSQRNAKAVKVIPSVRRVGENVAYGANSAKEVVTMWKNSPGHRKNMLGKYRYIGIGIAKSRRGVIYYTEIFAG